MLHLAPLCDRVALLPFKPQYDIRLVPTSAVTSIERTL
jgi:hypothetical protein